MHLRELNHSPRFWAEVERVCPNYRATEDWLKKNLLPGRFLASSNYRIERTTPPSTRKAAPFVAEESGLATKVTIAATSSVVSKRCRSELGHARLGKIPSPPPRALFPGSLPYLR